MSASTFNQVLTHFIKCTETSVMLYQWSITTTPLVRCTINIMLYHWMLIGIYTGESWHSTLMDSLKEQLKDKRMIYDKDQLELSTTVGQGRP